MARLVLIAGFESFNIDLYRKATDLAASRCHGLEIFVFSDRNLLERLPERIRVARWESSDGR